MNVRFKLVRVGQPLKQLVQLGGSRRILPHAIHWNNGGVPADTVHNAAQALQLTNGLPRGCLLSRFLQTDI